MDTGRVLVVGDTHGDVDWCVTVSKLAGRHGAHTVLQVGDFGWFPRMVTRSGRPGTDHLAEQLSRACERHRVPGGWVFVDGNHEDHDALAAAVRAHDPVSGPLVELAPAVRYAPRGVRFDLDGVTFGAFGGAVSVDAWAEAEGAILGGAPYRPGWDWFPDREAPTGADAFRLLSGGRLDVLLTHDAPAGVDLGVKGSIAVSDGVAARAERARQLVAAVVAGSHAKLVLHGHWHRRYSATVTPGAHSCRVEGLAANVRGGGRDGRAWVLLDLPSLDVHDGRRPSPA